MWRGRRKALGKIEGRNPVIEAIRAEHEIDSIVIANGAQGSVKKIVAMAKEKGILVKYVDKKKLDELAPGENHQGVVAFVSEYGYSELEDVLSKVEKEGRSPFIIILDGITDPHNLGAIIRTADASGADAIVIPKRRSVGITSTVVKSSAGAVEYVPVCRVTNLVSTIKMLKEEGVWVAALDMGGQQLHKSNLKGSIALVVGSEGEGVSRLVRENCDFTVSIPMKGRVSSLNASVAAGVVMYEVLRQRGDSEG